MAGMKHLSRRDAFAVLPAMVALPGALLAQTHSSEFPAPQGVQPAGRTEPAAVPPKSGGTLGASRVIAFASMPVRKNAFGGESREIAHGTLPTGETVNLHETMQVVDQAGTQMHTIQHSEFVCVCEGELEFQHEAEGKIATERVGPGGVLYVALQTKHAVKNVGTVPAKYFVVAIGGDAK
jgi:mannose-6-phosphate isomerase-like protein (cupin superfamily)